MKPDNPFNWYELNNDIKTIILKDLYNEAITIFNYTRIANLPLKGSFRDNKTCCQSIGKTQKIE